MKPQQLYRAEPKKNRPDKMEKAYNFDQKAKRKAVEAKKKATV